MKRRTLFRLTGVTIATAIAGCSSEGPEGSTDGGSTEQEKRVEILSEEFYVERRSFGVRGTAQNTSSKELALVGIDTFFYNSEGVRIAEGYHVSTDVPPDEKFKYDSRGGPAVDFDPNNIDRYEMEVESDSY